MIYQLDGYKNFIYHSKTCLILNVFSVFCSETYDCSFGSEDPDQWKRIVPSIHDTSDMGLNRITEMVSGKYYWPDLTSEVYRHT